MKWIKFIYTLMTVFCLNIVQAEADTKHSLPNIVFILVDDMGWGDPQCYQAESGCVTPAIDRLCAGGMKFTDAHSADSVCHPSRFGLLTGRYPFRYSMDWRHHPLIPQEHLTVPALLKTAEYQTAMVGKWHLGFEDGPDYEFEHDLKGGPMDRGFQSYFGIPASTDIPPYYYISGRKASPPPTEYIPANSSEGWSPIQGAFWREGLIAKGLDLKDVLDRFGDESIQKIEQFEQQKDQPYFLYLALPAPHTPWLPADKYLGIGQAGMYSEFVAHVDAVVGKVVHAIEQSENAENTMIIFTSDNGPTWYESDRVKYGHSSAAHWRGMKADAWEGGHRVPFIVRWPALIPAGRVSERLISFIDLLPTMAELIQAEVPEETKLDGESFADALLAKARTNQRQTPRQLVVHHSGQAVRYGDWKLINQLGSLGFTKPSRIKPQPGGPTGQLYDLSRNPAESHNLWDEMPQQRDKLLKILKQIREQE